MRGTWRHTLDSAPFENLNLQLRKSQSTFLCASVRVRERANACKDALIRRGTIKAELWVSNRSNKPTFLSSFFLRLIQRKEKAVYFQKMIFFQP